MVTLILPVEFFMTASRMGRRWSANFGPNQLLTSKDIQRVTQADAKVV